MAGYGPRLGTPVPPCMFTGSAELLAQRPQRLVDGRVQRREVRVGRDVRDHHAAEEARVLDPADLVERVVDVVEQQLRDTGAAAGELVAEVGQPAVVRADARPSAARTARGTEPGSVSVPLGKNGGMVLGIDDLADDAVALELGAGGSRCRSCARTQVDSVSSRSWYGFTNDASHADEVVAVPAPRGTRAYIGIDAPAWQSDEITT